MIYNWLCPFIFRILNSIGNYFDQSCIYSIIIFSDSFTNYYGKYYYFYIIINLINNESFLTIYYMQFNRRTVLHGLAFLIVQLFPIIIGVSLFYTQNNACSADPRTKNDFCFLFPVSTIHYVSAVSLLAFLILFSTIYSIFLYYFWSREIWPIIHKQSKSKHRFMNGK